MSGPPRTPRDWRRASVAALEEHEQRARVQRATDRFAQGRRSRLAAYPDALAERRQVRAWKQQAVDEAEPLIARFEQALTARGGQLHRVADGAELRQRLVALFHQLGARSAVKSKSMTTEETAVNAALEAAGVEVVETDLGEYIVQLGEEPPSHIIVPAIHRDRHQVSALFERRLGVPRTDDIAELTQAARATLRARFLAADVGITGANLAIADQGLLVVIENEGNARMVSSVPPVHIAIVGQEKLLPSLAMWPRTLKLLIRSATGQPISSYVSLIGGPRQAHEHDGPGALHVFLLDGGRGAMRADPALREALLCLRCGACLNVCPVYRQTGGHAYGWTYPGPIGAVLAPPLLGQHEGGSLSGASTLCGACRDACPVMIDIPGLLLEQRRRAVEGGAAIRPEPALAGADRFATEVPGLTAWEPSPKAWQRRAMRHFRRAVDQPTRWRRLTGLARRGLALSELARRTLGLSLLPQPLGAWRREGRALPQPAGRSFSEQVGATHRAQTLAPLENTAWRLRAVPEPAPPHPTKPADGALVPGPADFQAALRGAGAEPARCTPAGLETALQDWLTQLPAGAVALAPPPADHPASAWWPRVEAVVTDSERAVVRGDDPATPRADIEQAACGISCPAWAIAETGSLVERSGTARERLVSLLPGASFALVAAERLLPDLQQAAERIGAATQRRAAHWIVSGPSKTGDIELIHTVGVHGPGRLGVLLVGAAESD